MPAYVIIVDFFSLALMGVGFVMAFRQDLVRHILNRNGPQGRPAPTRDDGRDPLTYVLRIAGVMVMAFGLTLGGMITLFHLV